MTDNQNNHVKPTPEELKAQELAAIAEAEALADQEPEVDPEEEAAAKADAGVEPEEESEDEPEEEPEEEQAEPSKEEKEALKKSLAAEKKKSSASARENQKIYAKNRVINKALTEADEIPEPTDEELAKDYPDWDVLSDIERELIKETAVSRNWRKVISQAKEQATKIEKWQESVEDFVEDPETLIANPELEGKAEEFKAFATEEANNSVPFKILVSAFLHEHAKEKKPNKGKMFERGSGGPNDKPQPGAGKISLEDSRKLRETDYPAWKEKLDKGLIDFDL